MQKEITGIFFDIGGVLLNIHPERTIQHLNNCTGISKEIIKTAFSHEINNKYEKGEINNQEYYQSIKQARKIGLNSHHFISTESLKQKMRKLGLSFLKDDST